MITTNKIHDKFFKQTMSDLRVAKDFFNLHLPEDIQQQVNLDTLQLVEKTNFITPRSFIDNEQDEQIVDMLYSVKINGENGYFYALAEHQSTQRKDMPLRVMRYMMEVIAFDIDKQKEDDNYDGSIKFPIVIPIIFYNGRSSYNLTTSFLEMYPRGHRELAERILTNPFQLVDLNNVEDEQLRGHIWASVLEMAMQANLKQYRNNLELLAKKLVKIFKTIELEEGGYDLIEEVVCYTGDVADIHNDNPEGYFNIISQELSEISEEKIVTLRQRLIEKEKQSIILKMLEENVDLNLISKVTDFSIEEIKKLQNKNKQNIQGH